MLSGSLATMAWHILRLQLGGWAVGSQYLTLKSSIKHVTKGLGRLD